MKIFTVNIDGVEVNLSPLRFSPTWLRLEASIRNIELTAKRSKELETDENFDSVIVEFIKVFVDAFEESAKTAGCPDALAPSEYTHARAISSLILWQNETGAYALAPELFPGRDDLKKVYDELTSSPSKV